MVRHISSGSTFEDEIGYSRAVVDDHYVHVSGTTGTDYSTMTVPDSIEEQVILCIQNIHTALVDAGSSLDKVIRVNYVLPNRNDFEACWPTLRQAFAGARPAAMMIEAGLIDPAMKIEIEVTALR